LFADLDLPTSLSNQFIRPKPLTQVRAITSHHVLVRAQLITEVGARHTCLPIYFIIYTSSNNTKSELAAHFIVGWHDRVRFLFWCTFTRFAPLSFRSI